MIQVTIIFTNGEKSRFEMELDTKSFLQWAMHTAAHHRVAELFVQFNNGTLHLK